LHDELLPKKRGENPRRTPTTLVDGIAHARQRMGDTALGPCAFALKTGVIPCKILAQRSDPDGLQDTLFPRLRWEKEVRLWRTVGFSRHQFTSVKTNMLVLVFGLWYG